MTKLLPAALAAALITVLAACGPLSSSTAAAPPAAPAATSITAPTAVPTAAPPAAPTTARATPATAAAKAAPSPACTLKTTYDYIERDALPGASAEATEVGNVDLVSCSDTLATFRQQARQADGECTTIALASKNPGYNVDAIPAPPLKDVIMSAGPGC